MKYIVKGIEFILSIVLVILLIFIMLEELSPRVKISNRNKQEGVIVETFNLDEQAIIYNSKENINNLNTSPSSTPPPSPNTNTNNPLSADRKAVLDRAQAMVDVKWTPKYNLTNKYATYTFIKGKTYTGVPYSMDFYQVRAVGDFLSKIGDSKIIYGNDCSGFVSACWGISRQTTFTFNDAVKKQKKIDGKLVVEISWDDLKPGDALLLDNGKGKGHIVLYINTDEKDKDKMNVYEQNVPTIIPFEPMPVARKDIRSKAALKKEGYFPIRLKNLD